MPRFFLFTVTFLFTFLYNIVQAQKGEPTLIEQQYNVKLISPKQLSPFSTLQSVVQDHLGFIWITPNEGLHCLDGNDLTTYNRSQKSGKIDVVKEGDGYFRMALGTNNILWVTENISGDIIGFDVLHRKEIARVHVAEYYSDGNLQTLNNGKTFLVYTDKENTTFLTCVSCPDLNKKKLFQGKAVQNYKAFQNEHWVHGDSTFFQYASERDLINSYTDHKKPRLGGSVAFSNSNGYLMELNVS